MDDVLSFTKIKYGNDVFVDSCKIIETAKKIAYSAVDNYFD